MAWSLSPARVSGRWRSVKRCVARSRPCSWREPRPWSLPRRLDRHVSRSSHEFYAAVARKPSPGWSTRRSQSGRIVWTWRATSDRTGALARIPWVTALTLMLPLIGLGLLLARPELDMEWHHEPSHFWLVLLAAAVNAVLAYVTNIAAGRYRDARVVLISLAFLSSAGFLGLHALATPGVLLAESQRRVRHRHAGRAHHRVGVRGRVHEPAGRAAGPDGPPAAAGAAGWPPRVDGRLGGRLDRAAAAPQRPADRRSRGRAAQGPVGRRGRAVRLRGVALVPVLPPPRRRRDLQHGRGATCCWPRR